jgi:hypothetical protein
LVIDFNLLTVISWKNRDLLQITIKRFINGLAALLCNPKAVYCGT